MKTYDGISIGEATAIQQTLCTQVSLERFSGAYDIVGGADVSLNLHSSTVYAGIVLLRHPQLTPIACSLVKAEVRFPYVPGFLAFREIPPLQNAWEMLPQKPGVLVIDGHGIAHPRKMGIASHFGVVTGQVSMGCAKNLLFGKYVDPGPERGDFSPILNGHETLGYALRTKKNVKPVYVSPGHKMHPEDCMRLILSCLGKHRLPEPTRLAHQCVNDFRTGRLSEGFHLFEEISLF